MTICLDMVMELHAAVMEAEENGFGLLLSYLLYSLYFLIINQIIHLETIKISVKKTFKSIFLKVFFIKRKYYSFIVWLL